MRSVFSLACAGLHQPSQLRLVFSRQQQHRLIPERRLQVDAQRAVGAKRGRVQRQRDHQAQAHGRQKLVRQAADAPPRARLHQAQHARHLKLLAQLADADADLVADLIQ